MKFSDFIAHLELRAKTADALGEHRTAETLRIDALALKRWLAARGAA